MNIDRDDEYATRHEAAPTIEEQIEYMKRYWWQYKEGYEILASLQKLAALESQPVPVEPDVMKHVREDVALGYKAWLVKVVEYIDALKLCIQKEIEFRKEAQRHRELALSAAEKAESELAALRARLMEPDAYMRSAGYGKKDYIESFKAMTAVALKGKS